MRWSPARVRLVLGVMLRSRCLLVVVYPVFVMKLLCFALFACAFNLLLGFTGLLSFGHAAFFGARRLRCAASGAATGA